MAIEFEDTEYNYFKGKQPDKIYVSKRIDAKEQSFEKGEIVEKIIPIRYASQVIDSDYHFEFIKERNQIKLRITPEGRQEITAKFLEDSRGIYVLQIQKYTSATGSPHKTYFSFRGDEIGKLYNFIKSIKELQITDENGFKITDENLKKLILTKEQAFYLYSENQYLFEEIFAEKITQEEISNLVYKKEQLNYFENLLYDNNFFEEQKSKLNLTRDEALWQYFFENKTWIFGFGLQYIINIPLENKKLEQVVEGFDIVNRGKRTDALMKSKGIINSLCFAEIKTHKTKLLASVYRPNVFPLQMNFQEGFLKFIKLSKVLSKI